MHVSGLKECAQLGRICIGVIIQHHYQLFGPDNKEHRKL